MRESTRRGIQAAVDQAIQPIVNEMRAGAGVLSDAIGVLEKQVGEIQPAQVDLTQEMADDIVRKIHGPLTISKEFSDWLAEQGKFHDLFYVFPIGYGSDAGRGEIRATANGTMFLQIRDCNGADLWRGTFVPPDFGKS